MIYHHQWVHSNQENQETMKNLLIFEHTSVMAENRSKNGSEDFHEPWYDLEGCIHHKLLPNSRNFMYIAANYEPKPEKIDGRWKEKEREQIKKRRGGRRWITAGQRTAVLEVAGGGGAAVWAGGNGGRWLELSE